MAAIEMPTRHPLWLRVLFAVPLFGWIARAMTEGGAEAWFFGIFALVCFWGCSILLFGVPGLYIPAVLFVPVMFLILIVVSRG